MAAFYRTSQHLPVQSQQWKHRKKVRKMFKINNKKS